MVNPVRNSIGALNPALRGRAPYGAEPGIILKPNPAVAAGPGSAPEGLLPRREGLWPGGSSGALFLTGVKERAGGLNPPVGSTIF